MIILAPCCKTTNWIRFFLPQITGITSVKDVVEEVVTRRELSPNNYALYLVLGDSESHRVLCFTERLLAVLCSAGTNHFLCLKKNVFWETLRPYVSEIKVYEP